MRLIPFIFLIVLSFSTAKDLYEIGPSKIHGKGVIVSEFISKGERVAPAIVFSPFLQVTEVFGRWLNHCEVNYTAIFDNETDEKGNLWMVAAIDMDPGDEITCNYDAYGKILKPSDPHYTRC